MQYNHTHRNCVQWIKIVFITQRYVVHRCVIFDYVVNTVLSMLDIKCANMRMTNLMLTESDYLYSYYTIGSLQNFSSYFVEC